MIAALDDLKDLRELSLVTPGGKAVEAYLSPGRFATLQATWKLRQVLDCASPLALFGGINPRT